MLIIGHIFSQISAWRSNSISAGHGYALNQNKLGRDTEALIGLYDAVTLLESKDAPGKLKGKITIKLEKDLETRK